MPALYVYSDIDDSLDHNLIFDLDSIRQSIWHLLTTPKGTRMFLAAYGADIQSILFEPDDIIAEDLLFKAIIDALSLWEGQRINLLPGACVVIRDPSSHVFYVNLVFGVKGLASVQYNYSLGISP